MTKPVATEVDLDDLEELLRGCEHHEDGFGLAKRYMPRLIAENRAHRAAKADSTCYAISPTSRDFKSWEEAVAKLPTVGVARDLADEFSLGSFTIAGLSVADAAIALVVVRRILEELDSRGASAKPPAGVEVTEALAALVVLRKPDAHDYELAQATATIRSALEKCR